MLHCIGGVLEEWHAEFHYLFGALCGARGTLELTAYSLVGNKIEELIGIIG
jgi:hypothetical protein